MKILDKDTKFAHLGKPGTFFTKGFQRRLDMISNKVDLKGKKILDMGTGEGVWLGEFTKFTSPKNIFASEYDSELVEELIDLESLVVNQYRIPVENIKNCAGENLDFPDNFFDIVFHNEVLEHVKDDEQTLAECLRVLKPGGKMVFFTPNRGWPFEQHGMFFQGKYYWGNIPFLPWMPEFIFNKFAPHVKNYWWRTLRSKIEKSGGEVLFHRRIFPGFDKLTLKWGLFGRFIQRVFYALEKTPLEMFGISHFVIVTKNT
jgi:ubiquinone/menaquinone biosynthesis C-methylase UbiE